MTSLLWASMSPGSSPRGSSIQLYNGYKAVPVSLCPALGNHKTTARGEELELSMYWMQVVICNRAGFTLKLWAEAPLLSNLPDSFNDLEFLHWSDRLPKHDSRTKDDKDSKAQIKQGEQSFVSVKMENVIVVYFNYTTEAWTFTAKDGCLSRLLDTALSVLNKEFIRNKSWKK